MSREKSLRKGGLVSLGSQECTQDPLLPKGEKNFDDPLVTETAELRLNAGRLVEMGGGQSNTPIRDNHCPKT